MGVCPPVPASAGRGAVGDRRAGRRSVVGLFGRLGILVIAGVGHVQAEGVPVEEQVGLPLGYRFSNWWNRALCRCSNRWANSWTMTASSTQSGATRNRSEMRISRVWMVQEPHRLFWLVDQRMEEGSTPSR